MHKVYIGLGSNLDDPKNQIQTACKFIKTLGQDFICSSLYRSSPMGPADQDDFINAVCYLQTALTSTDLLLALQEQERKQNRIKTQPWGPRTIDLDILLFDKEAIKNDHLTIPHPGLETRLFVLMPLEEIAPKLVLPSGKSILHSIQDAITTTIDSHYCYQV